MRKKALVVAAIVSIVIAGCVLSTGIVKENKSKTEVNSQSSTSISEQVETPETATSAESNIEIIEDETSISDDGLTSSNAGGSSEPVEVEITEDGVVTDKPEPYPDEYSLITQPEDSENSENNENNVESGVIKGPDLSNDETSSSVEIPKTSVSIDISPEEIDSSWDGVDSNIESGHMSKEDFIKMVQESGTTLH